MLLPDQIPPRGEPFTVNELVPGQAANIGPASISVILILKLSLHSFVSIYIYIHALDYKHDYVPPLRDHFQCVRWAG